MTFTPALKAAASFLRCDGVCSRSGIHPLGHDALQAGEAPPCGESESRGPGRDGGGRRLRFQRRQPPESEPGAACVGAAESRGGHPPPASRAGASAAIHLWPRCHLLLKHHLFLDFSRESALLRRSISGRGTTFCTGSWGFGQILKFTTNNEMNKFRMENICRRRPPPRHTAAAADGGGGGCSGGGV